MSVSINRVQIAGHLGRDPEVRETKTGSSVATMSVATTEYVKDGENRTEWHRAVAFGKTADACREHLHKGSLVLIDGRLQTRQWEDRDGNKRSTTEVVVGQVVFLDKQRTETAGGDRQKATRPDYDSTKWKPGRPTSWEDRQGDDDVPF